MKGKTMSDINDTEVKAVVSEGVGAVSAAPLIDCKPDPVSVAEGVAASPIETYICPRCKFTWKSNNFAVSPMLKQATGRGFYCPQCYEAWIDSYVPIMRKQ